MLHTNFFNLHGSRHYARRQWCMFTKHTQRAIHVRHSLVPLQYASVHNLFSRQNKIHITHKNNYSTDTKESHFDTRTSTLELKQSTDNTESPPSIRRLPSGTVKTVFTAMAGNALITVLKGAVWMRTGSSAMLAETVHTLVDTLNQAFLALGIHQSQVAADAKHPYGYGRAAYVWGLISALGLFWCGAGVSIFHGVEALLAGTPVTLTPEAYLVLGASFAIDGYVLQRATREILRRAKEKKDCDDRLLAPFQIHTAHQFVWSRIVNVYRFIRRTKDPFMAAVFLEDVAACSGVVVALGGMCLSHYTGIPAFDHLASIVIGGMLGGVAVRLVKMNRAFLLGHAVDPSVSAEVEKIILSFPSIEAVSSVQTQWVGPTAFAYKAEVDFDGTYLSAELQRHYRDLFLQAAAKPNDFSNDLPLLLSYYAEDVTRLVERELKNVEIAIRKSYPAAVFIELEPDSKDTDRPMSRYVADKSARSAEAKRLFTQLTAILNARKAAQPDDPDVHVEQARLHNWFQQAEKRDSIAAEIENARKRRLLDKVAQKPK